jgi:hypothetical protein
MVMQESLLGNEIEPIRWYRSFSATGPTGHNLYDTDLRLARDSRGRHGRESIVTTSPQGGEGGVGWRLSVGAAPSCRGFQEGGCCCGASGRGADASIAWALARARTAAEYDGVITHELKYTAANFYVNNNIF